MLLRESAPYSVTASLRVTLKDAEARPSHVRPSLDVITQHFMPATNRTSGVTFYVVDEAWAEGAKLSTGRIN